LICFNQLRTNFEDGFKQINIFSESSLTIKTVWKKIEMSSSNNRTMLLLLTVKAIKKMCNKR